MASKKGKCSICKTEEVDEQFTNLTARELKDNFQFGDPITLHLCWLCGEDRRLGTEAAFTHDDEDVIIDTTHYIIISIQNKCGDLTPGVWVIK